MSEGRTFSILFEDHPQFRTPNQVLVFSEDLETLRLPDDGLT